MTESTAIIDEVLETTLVELRFVLARRLMPTAEAVALREGQVLTFDVPLSSPVDLVVDGVVVARGELVDVDGERGVRLTEIAGPTA